MPHTLWLTMFLPLLSFVAIVIVATPWRAQRDPGARQFSSAVAIVGIGAALLMAILVFVEVLGNQLAAPGAVHGAVAVDTIRWYAIGAARLDLGVLADPLAALMLLVVTSVSLLVQIYSLGYVANEPGYSRYFAFISFFTFSMLGLVLAPNFVQLFIFWELVGLSSYLLIGFWYERPAAAAAAKKAFLTTRLGDLGLLAGILLLYSETGTFEFAALEQIATSGAIDPSVLTLATTLLFLGAIGKSAQFPLHVWLPDAMEGPTPVSALIHAATMVAAGVYLVARTFPLFEATPTTLLIVASVGGFTALFAATMGLVSDDLKRVLAYSTVSQLGYMMLALGVGALSAGVFHLFTHAFFKALLFLAAGAVIVGTAPPGSNHGEQNLFRLGGLRRRMPWTALTFAIGALALAGLPPFAGFWSKDEILAATFRSGNTVLFVLALLTVPLTALYITRAWLLAFWGDDRARVPELATLPIGHGVAQAPDSAAEFRPRDDHGADHGGSTEARESPRVMVAPLVVLAVPATLAGILGSPLAGNWLGTFLHGGEPEPAVVEPVVLITSVALAVAGVALGYLTYGARVISAASVARASGPLYTLLVNRYYLDHVYNWLVGQAFIYLSWGLALFDRYVVDGLVNLVGRGAAQLGRGVSVAQSGQAPNYALAIAGGVVVIAVALFTMGQTL